MSVIAQEPVFSEAFKKKFPASTFVSAMSETSLKDTFCIAICANVHLIKRNSDKSFDPMNKKYHLVKETESNNLGVHSYKDYILVASIARPIELISIADLKTVWTSKHTVRQCYCCEWANFSKANYVKGHQFYFVCSIDSFLKVLNLGRIVKFLKKNDQSIEDGEEEATILVKDNIEDMSIVESNSQGRNICFALSREGSIYLNSKQIGKVKITGKASGKIHHHAIAANHAYIAVAIFFNDSPQIQLFGHSGKFFDRLALPTKEMPRHLRIVKRFKLSLGISTRIHQNIDVFAIYRKKLHYVQETNGCLAGRP